MEQSREVQLPPGGQLSWYRETSQCGLTSHYPQTGRPTSLLRWRPVRPGPGGPALPPPAAPLLLAASPGVALHQGGDEGGLLAGLQVYQAGSWENSIKIFPRKFLLRNREWCTEPVPQSSCGAS